MIVSSAPPSRHHYEASQAIWRAMEANGDIYARPLRGLVFGPRRGLLRREGTDRGGRGAAKLSPQGTPVEWTVEESWFFRFRLMQDKLLAHYEKQPDFIRPDTRRNEMMSFVKGGLSDLSVSRTSFDWGVPVPAATGPCDVCVGRCAHQLSDRPWLSRPQQSRARKYWPADLHIIGKDIVRFHTVYWPAFLMSAGLPLPKQVFGHGFLLNRGEKMSKSVGNVIDPIELAETYGVDQLRYFLLREVSFGQDGSYSHEAIVTRCNADLANGFGNLAQRCLSSSPRIAMASCRAGRATQADEDLLASSACRMPRSGRGDGRFALHKALGPSWGSACRAANQSISPSRRRGRCARPIRPADRVLYVTAEAIRTLAILAAGRSQPPLRANGCSILLGQTPMRAILPRWLDVFRRLSAR
jgi:methionyl-tRNA synthetase